LLLNDERGGFEVVGERGIDYTFGDEGDMGLVEAVGVGGGVDGGGSGEIGSSGMA
jgi:hypothetical protein